MVYYLIWTITYAKTVFREVTHFMHTQKSRLHVLDLLRGILFLNMAAYHFLYDWVFLFGQSCPFMNTQAAFLWQQMICSGFILLAGCCCTLSRNPAKHGVQILGCGLVITLVTVFITPQEQILFGILHFTGLAYLITACLRPIASKLPALPACAVAFLLFAFTKGIYYGYLGFLHTPLWYLPDWLYQFPMLFILGLPTPDFYSGDYFPLIPWFFLFLVGYFGGPAVLKSKPFAKIQQWYLPPFNWIGRRTLFLYMLHQPVIFGALSLYFSIS